MVPDGDLQNVTGTDAVIVGGFREFVGDFPRAHLVVVCHLIKQRRRDRNHIQRASAFAAWLVRVPDAARIRIHSHAGRHGTAL